MLKKDNDYSFIKHVFLESSKFKILAFVLSLVFIFSVFYQYSNRTEASNPNDVVVGAIRWDGWVDSDDTPVTAEEERILGPLINKYKLPFYATKPSDTTVTLNGATQAIMDQEIAYAKDAGIDYWAFCWYGESETDDTRGMYQPRSLYLSSSYKNDVKWVPILFTHEMVQADEAWLVARMAESNYQTVLGGRPLIYCYNYSALVNPAQITRIRALAAAASLPDPYIVALDYGAGNAVSFAASIGADAISSYVTAASNGQTYSSVVSYESGNWSTYKNYGSGQKVIPWVTVGWDARPRAVADPDYKYSPDEQGYMSPDPALSQISNQLQAAINWVGNNSSSAEANAVLMYSWNEFSEGGTTLCPKITGDRSHLDAIKSVLVDGNYVCDNKDTSGVTISGFAPYEGQGYANNVHLAVSGSGSNYVDFRPTLAVGGTYSVYARWSAYTNRATDAPYTIYYDGGSQTVDKNQRNDDNTWVLLGSYHFTAGTSGYVRLTDNANGQVIADAVSFVLTSAPDPTPTPSSNYLLNPGFETDGSTQTPTNWSTWSAGSHYDADYTQSGNQHTGSYNLAHWKSSTYDVYTYQVVSVPNGTYTAKVWARVMGNPTTCYIKAQDYGGSPITTNISGTSYAEFTLNNIVVTNGQCIIGVYTAGPSSSAGIFDDITLTRN